MAKYSGHHCPDRCIYGQIWWNKQRLLYVCDNCDKCYTASTMEVNTQASTPEPQPHEKPITWAPDTGLHCVGGCKSALVWSNIADDYCCPDCNARYTWRGDLIKDIPETQLHEKPICYVAGALNDASFAYIQNVRNMILWADKIRALGYAVFIPGIDLLCGIACSGWKYDDYFNNSQPFLAKADIVFVCPGWENSKGTKRELDTAASLGVPVYYGDAGYKQLFNSEPNQTNFEKLNDEELAHVVQEIREQNDAVTISDEESARDRRRPKDKDTIVGELDAEALAELGRRIAEGPYRTTSDGNTTSMPGESRLPYMRADEGACDNHVGLSLADKVVCEQCKSFYVGGVIGDDNAAINKPKFIEESNNHNIMGYLKHDPHPEYRVVSIIPLPHSKPHPWKYAARFHTYIWELKDERACNEGAGPDDFAPLNRRCNNCRYFNKSNVLDSGESGGVCNWGENNLSEAHFRVKPQTFSYHGVTCSKWAACPTFLTNC